MRIVSRPEAATWQTHLVPPSETPSLEEDTGYNGAFASRWWRTTVGRICEQKSANNGETRVEAVAEARVARVHPPEEFAAGGIRIMSSTGNSARQLRFNCVTTDTELLTPVIGPHRLIFKIYSRLRG